MKGQTEEEMMAVGATPEEALIAAKLFEILKPGLRVNKEGKIETQWGNKYPLGLYRVVKRIINRECENDFLGED